jgi:uncharacterized membrane protein
MKWRFRLVGCCVVVALGLGLLGCGSEPESKTLPNGTSGAECPAGSTLSYETFAAPFFATYCTRCHSSATVGTARRGAPEGYDWDNLATIRAHASQIDAVAAAGPVASNDTMPPGDPLPTADERARLGHWLACAFGN